jgi:hypothetical protein
MMRASSASNSSVCRGTSGAARVRVGSARGHAHDVEGDIAFEVRRDAFDREHRPVDHAEAEAPPEYRVGALAARDGGVLERHARGSDGSYGVVERALPVALAPLQRQVDGTEARRHRQGCRHGMHRFAQLRPDAVPPELGDLQLHGPLFGVLRARVKHQAVGAATIGPWRI